MKLRDPSLADVILAAIDGALNRVYTAMPGVVQDYDADTQTATIQPAVRRSYIDDSGERVPERMPALPVVPVLMHGGGGYRTTYPIKSGDTGLLVFASCSIDKWVALGGEVDPDDDRRHHPSDAVFITGLRHIGGGGPLSNVPDFMSIGADDNDAAIEIDHDADEVRVGKGADKLVLVEDVLTNFMSALTHAINDTAPTGAAPNPTTNACLATLQMYLLAIPTFAPPGAPAPALGWVATTTIAKAK